MKIKSCYIENYGGFNKKHFQFNSGITVFEWENGTGKTTLASFVKAMFYGLASIKSNTRGFADRLHFCPFNDGKFGGSIIFEHNGAEYRIERFFDKRSSAKDEVRVYKDGGLTDMQSEDIEKYFFGMDIEAFEQTVFFTAEDADIYTPSSIEAKINKADEAETAKKILEEEKKKLLPQRGKNGLIPNQQEKIRILQEETDSLQSVREHLNELYVKKENIKKELAEKDILLKKGIVFETKLKESRLCDEEIQEYAFFKENIVTSNPTEEDFDRIDGYFTEIKKLEEKDKTLSEETGKALKRGKRKKLLLAVNAFMIITAAVLLMVEQLLAAVITVGAAGFLSVYLCVSARKFKTAENIQIERRKLSLRYEFCRQEIIEFAETYKNVYDDYDLKKETLINLDKQIFLEESQTESLEEKLNVLSKAREILTEYKEKLFEIEAAQEALLKAEESIKNKYSVPMQEKFSKYAAIIEEIVREKIIIDKEGNIYFETAGELKNYKYLSQGQKSALAFCFRMALVDSLFRDEKPFVILDDPFMSLDRENMEKMSKIVKAVSADRQIIYFCCHESRNMI